MGSKKAVIYTLLLSHSSLLAELLEQCVLVSHTLSKWTFSWQSLLQFLLFFPLFLKDTDHSNRLQGLAMLLVCAVWRPII